MPGAVPVEGGVSGNRRQVASSSYGVGRRGVGTPRPRRHLPWPRARPRRPVTGRVAGVLTRPDGRVVLQERVAHDPARVVLARVERRPVDVADLLAELLVDARLGVPDELAAAAHPLPELLGVAGQPLGADDQRGDDEQHQQLTAVDPEHRVRLPPRAGPLRGQSVGDSSSFTRTSRSLEPLRTWSTIVSPGVRARMATISSSGSVTGRPSIARMTSPGWMPARSAGPSARDRLAGPSCALDDDLHALARVPLVEQHADDRVRRVARLDELVGGAARLVRRDGEAEPDAARRRARGPRRLRDRRVDRR